MAQRIVNFSGGQVSAPSFSGVNQSLGNVGSLLGQYQKQEQDKITNTRAAKLDQAALDQRGIDNVRADSVLTLRAKQDGIANERAEALLKIQQAQEGRAVTKSGVEDKLAKDNEAIAKAIIGTSTKGTNADTIIRQQKAKGDAEILAQGELEKSTLLGSNYVAQVQAAEDAQRLNAQNAVAGGYGVVAPQQSVSQATKYTPGSILDSASKWWDGTSVGQVTPQTNVPGFAPVITGTTDDRIAQYNNENQIDYEGIRAGVYTDGQGNELVQDVRPENLTIDAPNSNVALSDTVIKQNRINEVKNLAKQGIISSRVAADYIINANAPKSLDEKKFGLSERKVSLTEKELKAKIDSGYFKKAKTKGDGSSISSALSSTVDAHAVGEMWDSLWTTDKDELVRDAKDWKASGYKDHEIGAAIKASMDSQGHVSSDDVSNYLLNIY